MPDLSEERGLSWVGTVPSGCTVGSALAFFCMAGVIPGQKKTSRPESTSVTHPGEQNAGIRGRGHVVMWE